MGNYLPCSRVGCRHDVSEHRQANDDRDERLLVGACQHDRCLCSQYVHMGRKEGNGLLPTLGDHGLAATRREKVALPPPSAWQISPSGLAIPK